MVVAVVPRIHSFCRRKFPKSKPALSQTHPFFRIRFSKYPNSPISDSPTFGGVSLLFIRQPRFNSNILSSLFSLLSSTFLLSPGEKIVWQVGFRNL